MLSNKQLNENLKELDDWNIVKGRLSKEFKFKGLLKPLVL